MRRLLVPLLAAALLGAPAVSYAANDACPQAVHDVRGTEPANGSVAEALNAAASLHAVPRVLLHAIAYVESGWQQFDAEGKPLMSTDHVCGLGIMQVTADGYSAADQVRLAQDYVFNIREGARILKEKWVFSTTTPPPAGAAADDPDVIENWYYALCLYNGCGSDPTYPTKVANVVHDPFRYAPNFPWIDPYYFTKPQDADPTYAFPSAFQARYAPAREFVFYDHTTGTVTKTVQAPTHSIRSVPMPPTGYSTATRSAYGPDDTNTTCEQCGGWRLAAGAGVLGRARWTNSVTGPAQSSITWRPLVLGTGGPFQVRAYVPAIGADPLATVSYDVGGTPVTVDQNARKNAWVSLGTHPLTPGDVVTLTDRSAVPGVKIAADAMWLSAVPTVHLTRSTSTVTYGSAATLTMRLSFGGQGFGGSPYKVALYKRKVGTTTWTGVNTYALDSGGGFAEVAVRPSASTEYVAKYVSRDPYYASASSAVTRVSVRQKVGAALSRPDAPAGTAVTVYASVGPNHAGQRVALQRKVDGVWRNVTSAVLDAYSRARFTVAKPAGTYHYRVVKPGDADHLGGVSPTRTLFVY